MKSFYVDKNSIKEKKYYINMLVMMGRLSNLFSLNDKPYLDSRVVENLFCRCLNAENLSRSDITADARKEKIGIGIKTWIDSDLQKIAEFNYKRDEYSKLKEEKIIIKIAELRNERIDFTMRSQNLEKMVYHCVKRDVGKIILYECPLEKINIEKIKNIVNNQKTIKFEDDRNKYSFNISKSTLYKQFDGMIKLDEKEVEIISDPFDLLERKILRSESEQYDKNPIIGTVFLPLYSTKQGKKIVNERSGLNQRFAAGRRRDIYEVYIPIPAEFREKEKDFFPERDKSFKLLLPNGKEISVKVCQDNGKALMSNPNTDLGKWLIDDVFKINPEELITYEMLEKYGIDSVMIERVWNLDESVRYYRMNFAKTGSYERFIGRNVEEDDE